MGVRCIWFAAILDSVYIFGAGALIFGFFRGGGNVLRQNFFFYFVIAKLCLEAGLLILLASGVYKRNLSRLYIWFTIQILVFVCKFYWVFIQHATIWSGGHFSLDVVWDILLTFFRAAVLINVRNYINELESEQLEQARNPDSGPEIV